MKKKCLSILVILVIIIMLFAGCSQPIEGQPVAYDSLAELSQKVGFDVVEPVTIPATYVKSGYYCLGDSVAEILYLSGDNQIIYAMSQIKNVKSDIEDYDEITEININGSKAKLTLKDGYVMLGVVEKGEFAYSIYSQTGLSQGEFMLIAEGF